MVISAGSIAFNNPRIVIFDQSKVAIVEEGAFQGKNILSLEIYSYLFITFNDFFKYIIKLCSLDNHVNIDLKNGSNRYLTLQNL